ncbi:MAG: 2-C-methyl-D-erythritol 4-phosphate cytidylyltransferase [Clostridia bacterium]|nr:2-C-methyl-D-erythritol 4-phosphate cytidylyltransferase [Clostridia bacterium]
MKTKTAFKYEITEKTRGGIPVIIVAAGSSTRMNGINKQLAEISGVPVIIRTLLSFENSEEISNIILVVRADDVFTLQLLTEKYGISKLTDIVCGGDTRQESVLKGLSRVASDDQGVLIHDGARPLVSKAIIKNVVLGLENYSAVTCAVSVVDTVKRVDASGKVLETLDRSNLVAVQTPQGVNIADYRAAIEKVGDVSRFTDDTSIMEAAGFEVLTVEGERSNIKITTKSDIAFAEGLLEGKE